MGIKGITLPPFQHTCSFSYLLITEKYHIVITILHVQYV